MYAVMFYVILNKRKGRNFTGTIFLFIYPALMYVVMLYVILNKHKGRNFTYTVSRACANIYRFGSSVILQLAGLRVVGGRLALYICMLLACIYLYCNHQRLAQLLHHFLPYITWIAPARQQCLTFC